MQPAVLALVVFTSGWTDTTSTSILLWRLELALHFLSYRRISFDGDGVQNLLVQRMQHPPTLSLAESDDLQQVLRYCMTGFCFDNHAWEPIIKSSIKNTRYFLTAPYAQAQASQALKNTPHQHWAVLWFAVLNCGKLCISGDAHRFQILSCLWLFQPHQTIRYV